jgi:hypothetical protein
MRNTTATKWELINGGGTGGNNFIDSLRKVGDSVYARKYGVFVYQYTDSAPNVLANNGLTNFNKMFQLKLNFKKELKITFVILSRFSVEKKRKLSLKRF